MSAVSNFFGSLYSRLSGHRLSLLVVTLIVLGIATVMTSRINMDEDLAAMLPDSGEIGHSYNLLQQAPLSRKILINVRTRHDVDPEVLLNAGDRLAGSLVSPFFTKVVLGPERDDEMKMFVWLNRSLPCFFTREDAAKLERDLTSQAIRGKVTNAYEELFLPTGSVTKSLFQSDPFDLRTIALQKLRFLSLVPNMQLQQNHFLSSDGQNLLIFAETGIGMTDSGGSRKLLEEFDNVKGRVLPEGIDAELLSGHSYAVANANRIKKDLSIVLGASLGTMFILFLVFLRSWNSLLIFLVPVAVLTLATSAVLLIYGKISAVTIGFASVLLGITDDYPLHVYFAMRKAGQEAERVVLDVARPVCFSALTLFGVFGALLLSTLPGQRQIGVFSIAGILCSVVLSLIVLPHFVKPAKGPAQPSQPRAEGKAHHGTKIIAVWLFLLIFLFWQGANIAFDGDIRSLNYVSKEIKATEDRFKQTWGDFRGMAMIAIRGNSTESVLQANERLFSTIRELKRDLRLVNVATILPSAAVQRENRERWEHFWAGGQGKALVHELMVQSERIGFSREFFEPFLKTISLTTDTTVTPEAFRSAGLGIILDQLTLRGDNFSLISLVPDSPAIEAAVKGGRFKEAQINFISPSRFRALISHSLMRNFAGYLFVAVMIIVAFLFLLFRNWRKVAYGLVPVITGIAFMLGVMGFMGISFNIFNVVAAILVVGLGVDFGVFMVYKNSEGYDYDTNKSVLLGGLTTVTGIGTLVLAEHPALRSIGITVLIGLAGAIPSALFVIPALQHLGRR